MADPFLGEIKIAPWSFPPRNWAFCNGQLLPINQNQALFAILGTTYGGNGVTTFALPNLQGRVPLHFGTLSGGGLTVSLGQTGGEETHTLTQAETAAHTHMIFADRNPANAPGATNNYYASLSQYTKSPPPGSALDPRAIGLTGGGQPHPNQQPYLVVEFCIATTGI